MNEFTILIPVHNGGSYLRAAVASVLAQTYPNFELIVLDNSSTDGSREFVRGLQDPRVRLITSDTMLSIEESWDRVRNTSRREFMTILGHDDLLDPDFLHVIDSLVQRHPAATLYHTHFRLIDGQGRFKRFCKPMLERESAAEFLALRLYWMRDSFGTGYVMRSTDYDMVGGIPLFPKLLSADDALWLMLCVRGYKATALEECFAYRIHRASTSAAASREASLEGFEKYLEFLAELRTREASIATVLDRYGPETLSAAIRSIYAGSLHQDFRRGATQRRGPSVRERLEAAFRRAAPKAEAPVLSSLMIKVLQAAQRAPAPARHLFHPLWRGAQEVRWWMQGHM